MVVRAHHDLVQSISKKKQSTQDVRERQRFLRDPHAYAKRLLNPPVTGKPAFSKEVANEYFRTTYHDSNRSFVYKPVDVPRPPLPTHSFDLHFANFDEFSKICRSRSNGSAPGLNGIPYLLYKQCTEVRRWLWKILSRVWKDRVIPNMFQIGRIRLLPKSSDTSHPKLMRPISILNAEGRIFWTVFQKRLSKYMLANGYIDSRVQKGFLEGVAGCVEHTTMQWEMIKHAKSKQRQIVMAWLDLENAYGSMRHMLVQFALKWFHVPQKISELVFRYYESIFLKVVTDDWCSDYFHLGIGVPQGCTASTIIFDVGFQVVLDMWKWLTRDVSPCYRFNDVKISVSCPTYADDVELVAEKPGDCQKSINAFQTALEWTQTLKAKPVKCRSLAFRLFRADEKSVFQQVLPTQYSSFDPLLTINNAKLAFIGDDDPPMFKYLGRWLQYNLKDDLIVKQVEDKLIKWLQIIEDSGLEGRMKAWIVNFHICSKLAWVLMVQDFAAGDVERWRAHIHRKFRRWIGLAKCTEESILYRSHEHFGLNFKDLIQLEKQLRVIKWDILKCSKDKQMKELYEFRLTLDRQGHIGRGNRTSPCLTLETLERARALEKVCNYRQQGRQGLGFRCRYRKVDTRADTLNRMKKEAEEKRLIVLHQYEIQASWMSWGLDKMMRSDFSWNTLLYDYSDRLLKFVINSQTNTLPTPDNLRRWNQKRNVACGLCGRSEVTLSHVLAGCIWVRETENKLTEDRYTWRHNNLLYAISTAIREQIEVVNRLPERSPTEPLIKFVRPGDTAKKSSISKSRGILDQARDWDCNFDLPEYHAHGVKYIFPQEVCTTPLKMDGYIISRKRRICVGIELTVPMEHNIDSWHQTKQKKYENELRIEAERNRWKFYNLILEIGSRGWFPPSVISSLNLLGIPAAGKICKRLSLLAVKSSYIIWINRFNKGFHPWRLHDGGSRSPQAIKANDEGKSSRFAEPVDEYNMKDGVDFAGAGGINAKIGVHELEDGKLVRDGKRSDRGLRIEDNQTKSVSVEQISITSELSILQECQVYVENLMESLSKSDP